MAKLEKKLRMGYLEFLYTHLRPESGILLPPSDEEVAAVYVITGFFCEMALGFSTLRSIDLAFFVRTFLGSLDVFIPRRP